MSKAESYNETISLLKKALPYLIERYDLVKFDLKEKSVSLRKIINDIRKVIE